MTRYAPWLISGVVVLLLGCVTTSVETGDAAYDQADYATALASYEQGAAEGDPEAIFVLGVMYSNGQGVAQDQDRAMAYYEQAADLDCPLSHSALGYRYLSGQGVEQDDGQALFHFLKGAMNGSEVSMYALGYMFEQGRGVEADPELARYWYDLAKGHGFPVPAEKLQD
ncbi:MAG: sel1 repeat family protein [Desulfovibrio sp.]|nr:MAG: sel1 repeat family protein [Desulfovibrio sp.]